MFHLQGENSTSSLQDLLLQGMLAAFFQFLVLIPALFSLICRQEEVVLRLVLERREAELREAMKLRHRLTTLLHALRVNMEHVG